MGHACGPWKADMPQSLMCPGSRAAAGSELCLFESNKRHNCCCPGLHRLRLCPSSQQKQEPSFDLETIAAGAAILLQPIRQIVLCSCLRPLLCGICIRLCRPL